MLEEKSLNIRKSDFEKNELTVQKRTVNRAFDSHWHDYFEIKLILDGHGTVIINGESYNFQKGSIYFVIPANLHMFKPNGTVQLYNVTIRESLLFDESIIRKLSGMSELFFSLGNDEFLRICYLMELLEHENAGSGEYKDQMVKNLLECLILSLIRKSTSGVGVSDSYLTAIQIATSYMRMNFRSDITVDRMSSLLGFSPSYFSTLFHKTTGTTFVKYLNDLRLGYAKKLLSYDKFSVHEICNISGFNSYSNFLKAFKKKYGVLPKDIKSTKGELK